MNFLSRIAAFIRAELAPRPGESGEVYLSCDPSAPNFVVAVPRANRDRLANIKSNSTNGQST
jgi:hypothetical protein